MGTLGKQPRRDQWDVSSHDLDDFLGYANQLAAKHGIPVEAVIQGKRVLEMERANSIAVQAGDFTDENLGGFGERIDRLIHALEAIAERG